MSGRSAYVRKKITEPKVGEKNGAFRGRAKSTASSDNATINEYPVGTMPGLRSVQERERERDRDITGVGTTNARFLKFSEPAREPEVLNYRNEIASYGDRSGGSQSGSSVDGRRDTATPRYNRPLEDFAYARARRPAIKTEDVSGIEKSGLRSMLDKKSEGVRKGLAKTFAFKKKDKRGLDIDRAMEFRPQSSATVRPLPGSGSTAYSNDGNHGYDGEYSPNQYQGSNQSAGQPPWEETNSYYTSQPPSSNLPAVPSNANAPPIKRWIGAGRPVQRWNKLRKDPELWDPNGDVLVFFGHKGQSPRPNPSFRLSSHIIEATESRYLITLLREGSTEEDIHMPPSPIGAPPMLQRHGHYAHGQQYLTPGHSGGYGRNGQPTPPISEDASLGESDGQISYEMYFPTSSNMTKADQVRHQITTRNVFALLYHASLVGLSLYQALADLHARLESYMPPEADNVGTILNYLSARGIDDVRNDPETAVSILAWSEGNEVRWEEGWRESFLHCAGMYSQLEGCADFKHVTPITRALLERACLETQLRVQAAEERLAAFQYSDMWPASVATSANPSGPVTTAPAKAAADRLQMFFLQHYTREFGMWPPRPSHDDHAIGMARGGGEGDDEVWLTRTIAQSLQKDFAALYDYLVNRDIVWDGSEARSSRKWMMVSETGNRGFEADTEDLPLTDMLIEFDNKLRFPHIPHPYPLVPESIPPPLDGGLSAARKDSSASCGGSGMFGGKSAKKNGMSGNGNNTNGGGGNNAGRSGAVERRIQLAYTEATNICILGSDFTHSDLIDSFGKFEKSDHVGEVDPSTARRGRWVLIYGILQTLASVSVDAPNVRYRDDVSYHLSPRLKGAKMPPWKTGPLHGGANAQQHNPEEAAHELSHCWAVQHSWNANSATNSGADSSAGEDGGTSPIGGYNFPKPRTARSVAGRSSVTGYSGYHTPAGMTARSVRSNSSRAPSVVGAYPTFSTTGSVMSYSESDAGSSVRSPPSTTSTSRKGRGSLRDPASKGLGAPSRQIERVEEHEHWPTQGQQTYSHSGTPPSAGSSQYQPAPLKTSSSNSQISGYGGFLVLDEMMDDQRSFMTAVSNAGKNVGDSETDSSTGPVIKDFDELDVIDDHAP
ncbi:hypothetical protein B0H66DRAFT_485418 [Apodospora peruviana]|uniref:DUF8004 domain-containing protein n=1 Tax=Apodospora peruviana TaxID=516989 RepID=A0AAE0HUD5_9PEZI|nr:hypothetical protein B0H66DRAFT_485418 [Apodospora peruviana]